MSSENNGDVGRIEVRDGIQYVCVDGSLRPDPTRTPCGNCSFDKTECAPCTFGFYRPLKEVMAQPEVATVESKQTESKPTNPKDAIGIAKLPMHLVSPIVKCYQAIAHFLGNVKYGAWNYRGAGVRYSVYKAALDRHVDAWWEGEEYDPKDGTPHLANALACIGILIEAKYTPNSIDDRPPSRSKELGALKSEFEAIMVRIKEQYKDIEPPKHWTIDDKVAP